MVISVRELTTHTQLGFIYPDRKETLKEFLGNLPVKDKIKEVTIDMKSIIYCISYETFETTTIGRSI